jgi:hypothetical protein
MCARWLPFFARQVLNPHEGFVWSARGPGVITGSDRYLDGAGAQDWKLAGVVTVAYGDGPDVSGSAAGRGGAEGIWVPTALLPRFRVSWSAAAAAHLTARHRLEPVPDPVGGAIPTRPDRGLGTGSAVRSPATVATQASPSPARGALDGISGPIGGQPASSSRYEITSLQIP